jgi:cell fate regulator YaaT (PSP1 superfamily)
MNHLSVSSAGSSGVFLCVRLWPAGRIETCLLREGPLVVRVGDAVVVQTDGGLMLGKVLPLSPAVAGRRLTQSAVAPRILRRATPEDLIARRKQSHREQEAYRVGLIRIRERGLAMKLTRVEQSFDGSRLVFYFTAEGRVDFRELVRDLAFEFKVRVEMRQVGVRDEARMVGGYGGCGRPLCCTTWLDSFEPISIRMAKRQELALNPSKLSGLCGRLKCCLRFELPEDNNGRPNSHPCSVFDEPCE